MYRNILLAVDLDEPGSWARALPTGIALAHAFSARLTICSVVRDAEAALEAEWSPIGYREMLDAAKVRLAGIASDADAPSIAVEVATGTICGGILDIAERISADLIVLASHAPGFSDRLWGANAARVARSAGCSVLIVRGEDEIGAGATDPAASAASREQ